jgi:hypothetical protein
MLLVAGRFTKVKIKMRINEIIEALCAHEISKQDAIDQLTKITNGLRKNNALEFNVEEVSASIQDDHGYLKLKLPYQYSKMKGKLKKGDKVDVVFIP